MSRKKEYEQYLKSNEWITKRDKIREKRKLCEICKEYENLQVHHLTYENLGNEKDEDLILLCKKCHFAIHKGVCMIIEDFPGMTFAKSKMFSPFTKALNSTKVSRIYFPKDKTLIARNISIEKANGKEEKFDYNKWVIFIKK